MTQTDKAGNGIFIVKDPRSTWLAPAGKKMLTSVSGSSITSIRLCRWTQPDMQSACPATTVSGLEPDRNALLLQEIPIPETLDPRPANSKTHQGQADNMNGLSEGYPERTCSVHNNSHSAAPANSPIQRSWLHSAIFRKFQNKQEIDRGWSVKYKNSWFCKCWTLMSKKCF